MQWDANGNIYQINTRVWLKEQSQQLGRPIGLGDIPDEVLDNLAHLGFGWVWFMGVWTTGEAGRQVSVSHADWHSGYAQTLGEDLTAEDISGSPFAIQAYHVSPDFGGDEGLAQLRDRLRARGMRLLLDFVPNHTALDHLWVSQHPEFYIHGTEALLLQEPYNFRRVETASPAHILAYGRDPNWHGWPDTFQLNYRHPGLRQAMRDELAHIAGMCDGVRCDMAMLLLPDIFARTWGPLSAPYDGAEPVDSSFWPEAIAAVRQLYPEFLFIAEVYWDLEHILLQQGFDFTYDKRFYDSLVSRDTTGVRRHLLADREFQRKLVRFLENHDEPRAAHVFHPEIHRAAAVATFLSPGLRLFHDGQLHGRKVRLSVHLARRPDEALDQDLAEFYQNLLYSLARPEVQNGHWRLLECRPAWEGNPTWEQFIASVWEGESSKRLLAVVNYASHAGQCYVPLPFLDMQGKSYILRDMLSVHCYERHGDDMTRRGLYLDMPAWGYHVFEVLESVESSPNYPQS